MSEFLYAGILGFICGAALVAFMGEFLDPDAWARIALFITGAAVVCVAVMIKRLCML